MKHNFPFFAPLFILPFVCAGRAGLQSCMWTTYFWCVLWFLVSNKILFDLVLCINSDFLSLIFLISQSIAVCFFLSMSCAEYTVFEDTLYLQIRRICDVFMFSPWSQWQCKNTYATFLNNQDDCDFTICYIISICVVDFPEPNVTLFPFLNINLLWNVLGHFIQLQTVRQNVAVLT